MGHGPRHRHLGVAGDLAGVGERLKACFVICAVVPVSHGVLVQHGGHVLSKNGLFGGEGGGAGAAHHARLCSPGRIRGIVSPAGDIGKLAAVITGSIHVGSLAQHSHEHSAGHGRFRRERVGRRAVEQACGIYVFHSAVEPVAGPYIREGVLPSCQGTHGDPCRYQQGEQ